MSQSEKINDLLLDLARHVQHDVLNDNSLKLLNDDNDDHYSNDTTIDSDHDQTNVNIAKATAMVVLFCASTLCGSIPFILNRWFKWTENNTNARSAIVVKCLLYFGGGVLLSTTFLHLLPEVSENIEHLQAEHKLPALKFHLAELLMCLGFFAMFFVEEIIHAYIHRHQKGLNRNSAELAFERGRSVRDSFLVKGRQRSTNAIATPTAPATINNNEETVTTITTIGSIRDDNITSSKTSGLSIKDLIKNDVENQKYEAQQESAAKVDAHNHDHYDHQQDFHENHHHHHHHHHGSHHHHHHHNHQHNHGHHSHLPTTRNVDEDMIVSSLRGLLIVLALSLHELFEGLAVGLEASAGNVWYMFGAVSAHKLVLAFCVGVELIVTRTRLWLSIVYVVTFAIVSPIGIGIGILISNEKSAASAIPSAILQGLATGTLLYVVFFEILSKEKSGLIAYLAFVIGFFFMFGLQFATGHEHTHSHGGEGSHSHNDDHQRHSHNHHADHFEHGDEDTHAMKTTEEQLNLLRDAAGQFTSVIAKTFNKE